MRSRAASSRLKPQVGPGSPGSRYFDGRYRNFTGQSFWARGYYVSTVGRDEKLIREYIKNQEEQDRREDGQLNLPFR